MVIKLDSVNFTKFVRILHDELLDIFEKQMDTRRLNLLSRSPHNMCGYTKNLIHFLGVRNPLINDLFYEGVLVGFREIYTFEPWHYHIEDSN